MFFSSVMVKPISLPSLSKTAPFVCRVERVASWIYLTSPPERLPSYALKSLITASTAESFVSEKPANTNAFSPTLTPFKSTVPIDGKPSPSTLIRATFFFPSSFQILFA